VKWWPDETRSQSQNLTHTDLEPKRPLMVRLLNAAVHALFETRSQPQKPAHKDLKYDGQSATIALEATYAPVSNRACLRSPPKVQ
jgi:hypothetical protein